MFTISKTLSDYFRERKPYLFAEMIKLSTLTLKNILATLTIDKPETRTTAKQRRRYKVNARFKFNSKLHKIKFNRYTMVNL